MPNTKHSKGKQPAMGDASEPGTTRPPFCRTDALLLLGLGLIGFMVFANALNGDFVYDDNKQIVANQYIQEGRHFTEAITSDVWAFKGQREEAWSNYWRPVFVLWLMGNYRMFGLESTLGWHLTNILLHIAVIVLAFFFLRRLAVSRWTTAAILLVFAVHPVHSESIAWISGSPDPLLACFFLGSLLAVMASRHRPHWSTTGLAWLLAALAMLTKEVGIVLPVAVFVLIYLMEEAAGRSRKERVKAALRPALPLMALAVVYFFIRLQVIGQLTRETPWEATWLTPILSAPSVMMFYLRQGLAPLMLGPSYPLRPVAAVDFAHFFLPLIVVSVAALIIWRCLREGPLPRIGLALFLLPLLPAFNVGDLMPEQIVHDRYLYLPVLGLFMVLVPGLIAFTRGLFNGKQARALRTSLKIVAAYSVLLAISTIAYNRAWTSELKLWERAVQSDPGSAFNWGQYAIYLERAGRIEEAQTTLDQSVLINPVVAAVVTRADLAIKQGRFEDAEADLMLALEANPTNIAAYERLTLVYQQTERVPEAIALLRQARLKVPYRRCAFTSNLAVLHYLQGDREQARIELETILPLVDDEANVPCRIGLFHLGTLYTELGLHHEARTVLSHFLDLTANAKDAKTTGFRARASTNLDQLAGR